MIFSAIRAAQGRLACGVFLAVRSIDAWPGEDRRAARCLQKGSLLIFWGGWAAQPLGWGLFSVQSACRPSPWMKAFPLRSRLDVAEDPTRPAASVGSLPIWGGWAAQPLGWGLFSAQSARRPGSRVIAFPMRLRLDVAEDPTRPAAPATLPGAGRDPGATRFEGGDFTCGVLGGGVLYGIDISVSRRKGSEFERLRRVALPEAGKTPLSTKRTKPPSANHARTDVPLRYSPSAA